MYKSYYKRVFKIAMKDPLKIPSMLRLKLGKTDSWKESFDCNLKPPLVVSIRPTQACNLRCVMCPQWGDNGVFISYPSLAKREVTTEEIKIFIDDISSFKPYVYFSGGEPLINPDIFELIKYANSKHMVTSLNTNGTYLKEKARELIESGLDYLYTSLDAPTDLTNNDIRKSVKGEGAYSETIGGIKEVLKLRDEIGCGLPIIQTQTTLVEENHKFLLKMANFLNDDLKVDIWGIGLCVHTTNELNNETTKVYEKEFGQTQYHWGGFIRGFKEIDFDLIMEQLHTIKSKNWGFKLRLYKPFGMKGFDIRTYYMNPDLDATSDPLTCMNPYVFAQMQPNGEIAFCGSQPDYTLGNIKEKKFLDLWNSTRAKKWREFLKKQLFPSCKRCWSLYEFNHFMKN